ncbi:MAG: MFS transporter [Brasilonema angustatum HA4187-MV1]|nr:MFS transporter [Brasilonema angustatum HA4187-MV1]
MEPISPETALPLAPRIPEIAISEPTVVANSTLSPSVLKKNAIRISLRACTIDGVFTSIYLTIVTGVLLSNFLVELNASPLIIGMLSSIPMLVNLIQPLGAYLSERTTSRFRYSLLTNVTARIVWLFLPIGIAALSFGYINSQQLIVLTLVIVLLINMLQGLGHPSWMSWMALLVPRKLRGRYFGLRNGAFSLTHLICIPIAGLVVSKWPGGALQGYGVLVLLGTLSGLIGLGCQYFQVDVNPQTQHASVLGSFVKNAISGDTDNLNTNTDEQSETISGDTDSLKKNTDEQSETIEKKTPVIPDSSVIKSLLNNFNFLMFLLYFSFQMFSTNLSAPYFSFKMLNDLHLDVSVVALYASVQAGVYMVITIFWGKLSDKIGNRLILILAGILLTLVPLFWLEINVSSFSIWLWLPLLHMLMGTVWGAIDLCNDNMQIAIAPVKQQSIYFGMTAAVTGVCGALGTTIGGFIAQNPSLGGLPAVFVVSFVFRIGAIIPLFFVQEAQRNSLTQVMQTLWIFRKKAVEN